MKYFLSGAAVLGVAVLLGGCVTATTTDGVETTTDGVEAVTKSVSSISHSTSGDEKKTAFVTDRFEAIRFESAKGAGENVETLAALLGETDAKVFARWMKANYAPLFADLKNPQELLARIQAHRNTSG